MKITIKIKILPLLLLIVTCSTYCNSQSLEVKTLVTADSLQYITLLRNHKVGYQAYHSFSPLTVAAKRRKLNKSGLTCGTIGFISNGKGYGNYQIKNDSIYISFINDAVVRDSISIKLLPTLKREKVISLVFRTVSETKESDVFKIITNVRSNDGQIDVDNFSTEEDDIKIELSERQLPIQLTINDRFEILIDKFENQEITYFFNHHKTNLSKVLKDKSFKLSELITIENF